MDEQTKIIIAACSAAGVILLIIIFVLVIIIYRNKIQKELLKEQRGRPVSNGQTNRLRLTKQTPYSSNASRFRDDRSDSIDSVKSDIFNDGTMRIGPTSRGVYSASDIYSGLHATRPSRPPSFSPPSATWDTRGSAGPQYGKYSGVRKAPNFSRGARPASTTGTPGDTPWKPALKSWHSNYGQPNEQFDDFTLPRLIPTGAKRF